MIPVFKVAARDKDGQVAVFQIAHTEIQTHEQVREIVRAEMPGAAVILVGIV